MILRGPALLRRALVGLRSACAGLVACVAVAGASPALAIEAVPDELQNVTVVERLGEKIDLDLAFIDHTGARVTLRELTSDGKPTLMTLNYYKCQTMCSVQLNALLTGMRDLEWTPGDEYRVVTVSFDHREGWELARDKREAYLGALERGDDVDWTFMVGDEASIAALADSLGFSYSYDERTQQWAHPAVIGFISPDGTIARYLAGISYPARDLKFALMDAAQGHVGSPVEKMFLSCFRYNDLTGQYSATAFGVMRLGGVVTMVGIALFSIALWRRDGFRRTRRT